MITRILQKSARIAITTLIITITTAACLPLQESNDDNDYEDKVLEIEVSPEVKNELIHDEYEDIDYPMPDRDIMRSFQPEPGDMMVFDFDLIDLDEFLDDPSWESILESASMLLVYRVLDNGYIEFERITPEPYIWSTRNDFVRLESWNISSEFIDFMNDPESILLISEDWGIEEEVICYALIAHAHHEVERPDLPGNAGVVSMWMQTESGNYFIERFIDWYTITFVEDHNPSHIKLPVLHDLESFASKYYGLYEKRLVALGLK